MTIDVAADAGTPTRRGQAYTNEYRELTALVREAGLLRRRPGFYVATLVASGAALGAVWTGVALVGDSWWQLVLAALLGVVLSQIAFLGHEACHRQMFGSARANEWTGRILSTLVVGISYGWWMAKHTRHHANPNRLGKDPDIESNAVAFSSEAASRRGTVGRWLVRRQGWFFLPLLTLEGWSLHVSSFRQAFGRAPVKRRRVEITFLLVRHVAFLVAVLTLLPPGLGAAFVGVQVGVFGFLLGGAFAPNHIGMPVVPRGVEVDFLRRQVLMSRNIAGGPVVTFLMGGLENQVEHHLFPSMARPNLRQAQRIVSTYCREHDIAYTQTGLVASYGVILTFLTRIGLRERDTFSCPLVRSHRG
ncbi:MAG: fatty acid desaturase family protein [Janthinobacterium lividum]